MHHTGVSLPSEGVGRITYLQDEQIFKKYTKYLKFSKSCRNLWHLYTGVSLQVFVPLARPVLSVLVISTVTVESIKFARDLWYLQRICTHYQFFNKNMYTLNEIPVYFSCTRYPMYILA